MCNNFQLNCDKHYKMCIVCSKKKNKKVTRVVDSISILCYNISTTWKDHIKNITGNIIFKGIDKLETEQEYKHQS